MIVATAVDETRRAAEECSLVRQREWEVDSWRQTKKVCRVDTSFERFQIDSLFICAHVMRV